MNYRGAYSGLTSYSVGDVVMYTDNVPYFLHNPAAAGTTPHDVRYWAQVPQPLREAVIMFHGAFMALDEAIGDVEKSIPANIDEEHVYLKNGDNIYMVSVDDSGDTPEVIADLVPEEGEEGNQGGD